MKGPKLTANNLSYQAVSFTRGFLANYSFPICPNIKFNAVKNASQDEEDNFSGDVQLSLEFRTISGVIKRADIVIPVKGGAFLEPSTFQVDGSTYIIAQSSIDEIVKHATFYENVPLKSVYGGPVPQGMFDSLKDKKIPKANWGLFSAGNK